jgi:hypothetical protein
METSDNVCQDLQTSDNVCQDLQTSDNVCQDLQTSDNDEFSAILVIMSVWIFKTDISLHLSSNEHDTNMSLLISMLY